MKTTTVKNSNGGGTYSPIHSPVHPLSRSSSQHSIQSAFSHLFESEEDEERNAKLLRAGRTLVFESTFINYAMSHWTRKAYTNVKVYLIQSGVSPITLAAMDSGFMFTYAGGNFITGQLGDHFSPVVVISIGLLGSTLCLFGMVIGASTFIVRHSAICPTWFLTCQLLHGAFQATGGPVNTAVMGNWFGKENRGTIFGLWTCHQYVGDIAAAMFSALLLWLKIDWRYCLIVPAVLNALWAVFNLMMVPNTPEDYKVVTKHTLRAVYAKEHDMEHAESKPIGFLRALLLPGVISYSMAFGFFKLINYAMFFQLPTILSSNYDSSTSDIISALYSVGMMPGGCICGFLSDLYGGRRACVIATFMALLCPLLVALAQWMPVMPIELLLVLLCVMGCLVGGPNNIITSAVAADLAENPSLNGNRKSLGTVTGIINGTGSIIAALGQIVIPLLHEHGLARGVGYRYVWYFLVLCTVMGTALLGKKIERELLQGTEYTFRHIGYAALDMCGKHPGTLAPKSNATVLYDFEAKGMDEMSVKKGDSVFVPLQSQETAGAGWACITRDHESYGHIPSRYVSIHSDDNEHESITL